MGLNNLPYDLLLNIATYLSLYEIHALHLTCKSLHDFASTRPVYRKLAHDLLGRCRALPLKGFQRLSDLSTDHLLRAVDKASRLEIAWRRRAPRPIQAKDACSDIFEDDVDALELSCTRSKAGRHTWYKVVSAPPNEEVDWLSPITSKYTLCATKSGKVVCWDVKTDSCLAEWSPLERWELWKCRVEFEQRTVFFTMAKVIQGSYDDERVMEFVLMKLEFFENPSGNCSLRPPMFSHISSFKTAGVVMNVFLLDPSKRLLSAFVWLSSCNTIGLYVLLDWEKDEYVFIDTAIEGVMSSNWSCILFEQNIVIHCEESNVAYQHFYPIPLLRRYNRKMKSRSATPTLASRLRPARSLTKSFVFPKLEAPPVVINQAPLEATEPNALGGFANAILTPGGLLLALPPDIAANLNAGLAEGEGPIDLAQILTPQQFDQLLAQVPLLFVQPGQNQVQHIQLNTLLPPGHPQPAPQTGGQQPVADNQAVQADNATDTVQAGTGVHNDQANNTADAATDDDEDSDDHDDDGQEADHDGLPNPFPHPWYPESAHFVRQWWPTLPGVPRVSCTVVLLAGHDQQTHATRFVLAQHYFRVPLDWRSWKESQQTVLCNGKHKSIGKRPKQQRVNGKSRTGESTLPNGHAATEQLKNGEDDDLCEGSSSLQVDNSSDSSEDEVECECGWAGEQYDNLNDEDDDDNSMRMWYVSTPFDVVCVSDVDDEDGQPVERPRPLIAVDFGHAVWIEYVDGQGEGGEGSEATLSDGEDEHPTETGPAATEANEQHTETGPVTMETNEQGEQLDPPERRGNSDPKSLRFVTFPPYHASLSSVCTSEVKMEGEVRILKIPDELDLDSVETINIDQSQGAVILSVREGKIFILCYE
ncbi:hypothetical protein M378DRAFT_187313 [Amanita muscaria Koide BX008]|uniref:F-box domain-containing protein n=1 Tax=Amanita muscaria (strain Koide BX008) TaxID=946122 RepID=A0A0C2T796_AMAMK|nr:hypothetical protein M378DRAFT_187313 [Amanita muscaria Koide BX008]